MSRGWNSRQRRAHARHLALNALGKARNGSSLPEDGTFATLRSPVPFGSSKGLARGLLHSEANAPVYAKPTLGKGHKTSKGTRVHDVPVTFPDAIPDPAPRPIPKPVKGGYGKGVRPVGRKVWDNK